MFTILENSTMMMYMTQEIDKHLTANGRLRKRDIMTANFLGGLAWGLGTVIGATVVVAVLLSFLNFVGYIPVVGELGSQLRNDIENVRPMKK